MGWGSQRETTPLMIVIVYHKNRQKKSQGIDLAGGLPQTNLRIDYSRKTSTVVTALASTARRSGFDPS